MLIVPYEHPDPMSAYTHSVFMADVVNLLIVLNGIVRKCISLILHPKQTRSIFYYFMDTFRIVHGGSSEMPLRNASEYVFRFVLSVMSTFYSSTICILFMQYVYIVNGPVFGTVADVQHADLPLFCVETGQPGLAASLTHYPDCMSSYAAPTNALDADGTLIRDLLHANDNANRTVYLTSEDRINWLRDILNSDADSDGIAYRVLSKPVTHQLQTFAVSMFNRNVSLYERYVHRAAEHGFLQYLSERNKRVNYAQYVTEQREFGQTRAEQMGLYAPMRVDDFLSSFLNFYFMWICAAIVCAIERLTFSWHVGNVQRKWRCVVLALKVRWGNGYAN